MLFRFFMICYWIFNERCFVFCLNINFVVELMWIGMWWNWFWVMIFIIVNNVSLLRKFLRVWWWMMVMRDCCDKWLMIVVVLGILVWWFLVILMKVCLNGRLWDGIWCCELMVIWFWRLFLVDCLFMVMVKRYLSEICIICRFCKLIKYFRCLMGSRLSKCWWSGCCERELYVFKVRRVDFLEFVLVIWVMIKRVWLMKCCVFFLCFFNLLLLRR